MPYQRKVSHKRCWQYNLLGERSGHSLLVKSSYELLAVNSDNDVVIFGFFMIMVVFRVEVADFKGRIFSNRHVLIPM